MRGAGPARDNVFRSAARAPRLLGALLALAHLAQVASAGCTNTTCSQCATAMECAATRGCFATSWTDYSPEECVTCEGCGRVSALKDTEIGLEAELGCHGSIFLGVVGGIFAFVLPCCVLRRRAQRQHALWMLSAPDTIIGRAPVYVQRSWSVVSGRSLSHMLRVKFQVPGPAGVVAVVAATPVVPETFSRARDGKPLEVAYLVGGDSDFELVSDLEVWAKSRYIREHGQVVVCLLIGTFGFVGLAIGAASGPLTGCYLGYVPFFSLLVAGSVCGRYVCWPLTRRVKRAVYFPTVKIAPHIDIAAPVDSV